MIDPTQQLKHALAAMDLAFAPLGGPSNFVGGCTHCYIPADLESLAGPVHQVLDELVVSVAHKTPDHWDDFPHLYRRLTPRIIRLLTANELDHSLVASRLLAAGWQAWPAPERTALDGFWRAWWRSALHIHPGTGHVCDVLEVLAVTSGTLAPWLDMWARTRTRAADLHLADALEHWLIEDELANLRLGFYEELHASPQLLPWLLSLEPGRISAAQQSAVEQLTYG
ncbi:hypothetical protein ABT160_28375 [Streptomyces sp. NPDC001941]|uniref:hypothetical protein n=1 Tax=Streptomyces sp. NPDC001941 TaxID=3154659 RepID=UPI003318CF25